jgi:hypothetical protein
VLLDTGRVSFWWKETISVSKRWLYLRVEMTAMGGNINTQNAMAFLTVLGKLLRFISLTAIR